jgi:hypothetical protein
MRHASPLILLSALACAPAQTASTPARTTAEATLSGVTVADAIERAKAAFVIEGLTIADASSAGTISSAPVMITGVMLRAEVLYRATVLRTDAGARVIYSGQWRDTGGAELTEAMVGTRREPAVRPLSSDMRSTLGTAWERVERLARATQP